MLQIWWRMCLRTVRREEDDRGCVVVEGPFGLAARIVGRLERRQENVQRARTIAGFRQRDSALKLFNIDAFNGRRRSGVRLLLARLRCGKKRGC